MKTLSCRALALAGGLVMLSAQAAAQDRAVPLAIAKKPVGKALQELAAKTGANILFTPAAVAGMRSAPVRATVTAEQGARKMLAGTGLQVIRDQNGALLIQPQETRPPRVGLNQPAPRREEPMRYVAVQLAALPVDSELPSGARATDGEALGDIVVTARRVAENLQDVPVAVTAYSGAALLQQNARAIPDVALLTPGLTIAPAVLSNSAVNIQMRGQVQSDVIATLDPSVGTYVDGVYWARAYGLNATLVDVESFQALKGPQGTLFGRNTSGGAILIITKDPSFSEGLSGLLSGTYGNYNYQALTAILNAPIVDDKLAVRLVYSGNRRDGFAREKQSGRSLGNLNDYTLRGKILIQPVEKLRVQLSAEKFHSKVLLDAGRLGYFVPNGRPSLEAGFEQLGAPACLAAAASCTALGNQILAQAMSDMRGNNRSLTQVPTVTTNTQTFAATAIYDTSFGAIKAIGAYRKVDSLNFLPDGDGSPIRILDNLLNKAEVRQWSGEVTATGSAFDNSLDFAAGGFAFHEYGFDTNIASTFTEIGRNLAPPTGVRKFTVSDGHIDTVSKGLYGQATWHVTNKFSVTGGVRYSTDRKELTLSNGTSLGDPRLSASTFICQSGVCPSTSSIKFDAVSYTAGVDYKIARDVLVYAKTAKGFRAGGQNLRANAAVPASLRPFKPEIAYNYELGLKSEFLDRRLRLNIAGYYTRLKDVQRTTSVVVGTTTATLVENAAAINIYGVEAEASAVLPGDFRVDATLGYTDVSYSSFIDFNGFDRSHERIPYVPKWTASVSPSWSHELGAGKLYARGDFAYQSATAVSAFGFFRDANGVLRDATSGTSTTGSGIPLTPQIVAGFTNSGIDRAHWLINARAGMTLLDGQLDVAVWGKNLSDKRDIVNAVVVTGLEAPRSVPREPRTIGVTATVKFR